MVSGPYPEIFWTRELLRKFMQAYFKAKREGKDTFRFEGHLFLANYAKYLIEYLLTKFGGEI
jgi:hypothetical protein